MRVLVYLCVALVLGGCAHRQPSVNCAGRLTRINPLPSTAAPVTPTSRGISP